jgi:hypothetical protein
MHERPGLTSGEIAARQGFPTYLIERVLRDEAHRGHVACVGDRWTAAPAFVREYGAAFRSLDIDLEIDAPTRLEA